MDADVFLLNLVISSLSSLQCGRLSWLAGSFLLHVKHTLSYGLTVSCVSRYGYASVRFLSEIERRRFLACKFNRSGFIRRPSLR